MIKYTEEIAADKLYPDITVYRQFDDDVQYGWYIKAKEGYVFYDTTRKDTEFDLETMEEKSVTYYYTTKYFPLNYNWTKFPYIAVPAESI